MKSKNTCVGYGEICIKQTIYNQNKAQKKRRRECICLFVMNVKRNWNKLCKISIYRKTSNVCAFPVHMNNAFVALVSIFHRSPIVITPAGYKRGLQIYF